MNSSRPTDQPDVPRAEGGRAQLERRVGLFDITMVVIGGIVGAGIFRNPHVVALELQSPALILGAWILGGLTALAGAFVYAELTALRDAVGGQYAFLKEAYHPVLAFLYGWALLLVIQTGGMAAVSVTFADYTLRLLEMTNAKTCLAGIHRVETLTGVAAGKSIAVGALLLLTTINCLGVRAGASLQSALTVLKMGAIAGLVGCGFFLVDSAPTHTMAAVASVGPFQQATAFGSAMVPVLFAYGGWQTACFIAGEVKNSRRNVPLGLLLGVLGVVALYLAVNWVCLRALGPAGLAATTTPAADVANLALGPRGSFLISSGIVISTLGFLSQGMLTAPRVYFAMADDGLFFRALSRVHPVTRVPVAAIVLQGVTASAIALIGGYEQILNYVVSVDFIFYGLTGTCVFIFRKRAGSAASRMRLAIPGHPWTTLFFIGTCWWVVANSVWSQPVNSLVGLGLMLSGIPVYSYWRRNPQN